MAKHSNAFTTINIKSDVSQYLLSRSSFAIGFFNPFQFNVFSFQWIVVPLSCNEFEFWIRKLFKLSDLRDNII